MYLAGTQSHFGVSGLAELCELCKDGHELIGQCGVPPTQLILKTDRETGREKITDESRWEMKRFLYSACVFENAGVCTHDQHSDQRVLLGDLGVGEDVVKHITHVAFVLFTQCKHTLVIVTWNHTYTRKVSYTFLFTHVCISDKCLWHAVTSFSFCMRKNSCVMRLLLYTHLFA